MFVHCWISCAQAPYLSTRPITGNQRWAKTGKPGLLRKLGAGKRHGIALPHGGVNPKGCFLEMSMLFVIGLAILFVTHLCGFVFFARRGFKLPKHGSPESVPMYWLALGYLSGSACVVVSVGMLLWRYLP